MPILVGTGWLFDLVICSAAALSDSAPMPTPRRREERFTRCLSVLLLSADAVFLSAVLLCSAHAA